MSDPLADAQLELACRVGSVEAIQEALEEGADIDCNGSTPLFIAITAGDREVVSALVARGADVGIFGVSAEDREAAVEALLLLCPSTADPRGDGKVDARLVRSFDRLVRTKGLAEPLRRGKGGDYQAFAKGLRWIAAEERHACVASFLELAEAVLGREPGRADLEPFLEANGGRIAELDGRYREADESPADLIREYLKDQKVRS